MPNSNTCPHCGASLPTTASRRCAYCGTEFTAKSTRAVPSGTAPDSGLPLNLIGLKRPKAPPSGGIFMLVFAIPWTSCIVLSFFFLGAKFFNDFMTYIRLRNEGVTIVGTVTHLDMDDSGDSSIYDVYYHFNAPLNGDETTFDTNSSLSESVYNQLETGGSVDVIYARSDPKISAVKADWGPPDWLALVLVFTFELVGIAVGVWMLRVGVKAGRNYLDLRARGELTRAIVFDRWEEIGSENSSYYVAYAYRVPWLGKQVFTNAEQSGKAYRKLKIGDTVDIRYLPDNPKIAKLAGF